MDFEQPDITAIINGLIDKRLEKFREEIKENLKLELTNDKIPILTVKNVSEITGLAISTIYKYCHEKRLGYYRPAGKQIFFSVENVTEFILNVEHFIRPESESRREALTEYVRSKAKS